MKRWRKRKLSDHRGMVVGVAWYSPAEWERLRAAVPDPDNLEETYEEWEAMASAALAQFEESGVNAKRVPVEAEEFLTWCSSKKLEPDSSARSQFAVEKLRQLDLAEPEKRPAPEPPDGADG
jgi:hypothetical protein